MRNSVLCLAGLALILGSCVKEELKQVTPAPGKEVRFSGNLGNNSTTRTAYGEETATGIKVNWKNGDKVLVYGTNCVSGRDCAEYKVTNADADGNEVLQNFANSLDKTGEFGVQWGMDGTEKCDFYSVYPSVNNGHSTSITPSPDGRGVTVRAHIRPSQFCVFNANSDATAYSGTPYDEKYTDGTMPDAFMYAVTPNQDTGQRW